MRSLRLILPGLFVATLFLASSAFGSGRELQLRQQADFSKYKNLPLGKHPQSVDIDELTMNQLGASLDVNLAKKA